MTTQYSTTKAKDYRRVRPEVVVSLILLLILAIIFGYVYIDSRRNKAVVDNTNNEAVLGVFEPTEDPYKTVYEDMFSVDVLENWTRINNPEIRVSGKRYYPIRYQGSGPVNTGRRLDVYIDTIPSKLPVNKILTVKVLKDKYMLAQNISPQCYTFTDFPVESRGEAFKTVWDGHGFTCLTTLQTNIVASVEDDYDNAIQLTGSTTGSHRVMLVFTDHGSRPDNSIFNVIVESFRLK